MKRFIVFGNLTLAHIASHGFAPPTFAGFAIIVTLLYYKYVNYLLPIYYST